MDVSRVVELRVHGVSGTPPQDLLDRPLVTQVAGDGIAGFYRPRLASERTDAVPGRDGPPLEGYVWGGLTSGSPGRALWLVLLPFTLINVAPRLRPGDPPGGPTRGSARLVWWLWYLSRLLALSLTMTLVVAFCGIGLDLLGWQCADPSRPCAAGSPGWLIGRVSELATGPRLAVGALVPLLVLAALALISGRTIARYEAVSDQARRDDNPRATEPRLDSAWMWRGEDLVRRLRHLHLQAGLAVVLAAVAWPIESWWRVVVLLVAAGAAGCAVALLSRSSVYGRGPNVPWVSRLIWAIWAVLGGITVSTAVLLLTSAVSFTHRTRPPHPVTAVGLPHYAGTLIWFFTAQLVLVVGLTVVALSLRRAGLVAAPAGPRPGVWGIGTLVLTLLGVFTGAVLSASAYIYAGAWLHTGSVKPSFQQATSVAAAFDVPESIRDASLTFAVSGAFVVVIAVFAAAMGAVRYALVRPGSRPLTGHEFADDYPGVSTATGRAKQIVRAFWRARLIDGVGSAVGLLLLPGTLLTLAVTVLLLLRPWSSCGRSSRGRADRSRRRLAAHRPGILRGLPASLRRVRGGAADARPGDPRRARLPGAEDPAAGRHRMGSRLVLATLGPSAGGALLRRAVRPGSDDPDPLVRRGIRPVGLPDRRRGTGRAQPGIRHLGGRAAAAAGERPETSPAGPGAASPGVPVLRQRAAPPLRPLFPGLSRGGHPRPGGRGARCRRRHALAQPVAAQRPHRRRGRDGPTGHRSRSRRPDRTGGLQAHRPALRRPRGRHERSGGARTLRLSGRSDLPAERGGPGDAALVGCLLQVGRRSRQELLGGQPRRVGADQHRQVLGHLRRTRPSRRTPAPASRRTRVTSGVPSNLPRYSRPRVQAKIDAIGLVEVGLPFWCSRIVPGDRAVRRLGLDGLAVRRHQHGGHQAERAEALRDRVGLHVAVVVLARPDVAALPLQRGRHHVVDQPVLVGRARPRRTRP